MNRHPLRLTATLAGLLISGQALADGHTEEALRRANQAAQARYNADFISRNRLLVENSYRSSWICGMAVDCVNEVRNT